MTDTAPTGTGETGAAAAPVDASSTPAAPVSAPAAPAVAAPVAPPTAQPAPTSASTSAVEPPVNRAEQTPASEQPQPPAEQPAWQDVVAAGDQALLNQLKRYKHPAEFGKAHRELLVKLSQGAHKQPGPPENATPEQLAAWRKEAGVPESPERYTPQLPNGVVLGTEDKPVVDGFAKFAHAKNWSEQQFNEVLGWYYTQQDAIAAQRRDRDAQFRLETESRLRQEWGPNYQRNLNAMINFRTAHMPEDLQNRLLGGRTADGTMIGNDPQFVAWMSAMAMEINPSWSVVPAGTSNATRAISDEIAQIESVMKSSESEKYWKNEAMQSRYRELLDARNGMNKRSAA